MGLVSACSSTDNTTANTYADENGWLYYATDCPEADPVLLAGADGLPPLEATEKEAVEAYADQHPQYRVIPRHGWVWERQSDGTVSIFQVEDYMLELTIPTDDDCPQAGIYVGIPVAFRVES